MQVVLDPLDNAGMEGDSRGLRYVVSVMRQH